MHTPPRPEVGLEQVLESLGADLEATLARLDVAMCVIDATGRIRWQNAAARKLVGARPGAYYTASIAPEHMRSARDSFARKLLGTEHSVDRELVVVNGDGRRTPIVYSSVPLATRDGIVGVFGVARAIGAEQAPPSVRLTPRQHETLRLLAKGLSTDEVAAELGIAIDTTRGHIRRLLKALGVRSRLEAVVRGRELGLV